MNVINQPATIPNTTNAFASIDDLGHVITEIVKTRQEWEAKAYAANNEQLYQLLSAAFNIVLACAADAELTEGVDALLTENGYTYSKGTSLELKVVRLIFSDKANKDKIKYRLHAYARVLKIAFDEDQTSTSLPNFIKDKGGIDEIRRDNAMNNGANTAEKFVTVAKKELADQNQISIFDAFAMPTELKPEKGSRYSLALVRDNNDGTGSIVHGIKSKSIVDKALEEAGKSIQTEYLKNAGKDFLDGAQKYQLNIRARAAQTVKSSLVSGLKLNDPQIISE